MSFALRHFGIKYIARRSVSGVTALPVAWRSVGGRGSKSRPAKEDTGIDLTNVDKRLARDRKAYVRRVSAVACTGCGATFQSEHHTRMGYLAADKLEACRDYERTPSTPSPPYICHRCHTLRTASDGINIQMKEEEYRLVMMKRITSGNCLILWLVDICDFPASFYTGLADIIGPDNPVVLVATKIDVLGQTDNAVTQRQVRECLLEGWKSLGMEEKCRLVAMHMISGATGEGVGRLMQDVGRQWKNKGDVFVVGSANAGKSTLFNKLIPLMCGISSAHRGGVTVSKLPGTTLRMIRLPLLSQGAQFNLQEKAKAELIRRLQMEKEGDDQFLFSMLSSSRGLVGRNNRFDKHKSIATSAKGICHYTNKDIEDIFNPTPGTKATHMADAERKLLKKMSSVEKEKMATLGEEVEQKYGDLLNESVLGSPDNVSSLDTFGDGLVPVSLEDLNKDGVKLGSLEPSSNKESPLVDVLALEDSLQEQYQTGGHRYLYDTPGLIHSGQSVNLLDPHEIHHVVSTKVIKPMILRLRPGMTLFLGGMGRLDYLDGVGYICVCIFSSNLLPVNVHKTADADADYNRMRGSKSWAVPLGDYDRTRNFPPLVGEELRIYGKGEEEASRDIVLSSAGWVSVTAHDQQPMLLRASTPGGVGIATRVPLVPYAVRLRGNAIRDTPAYTGTTGLTRPYKGSGSYATRWRRQHISSFGRVRKGI